MRLIRINEYEENLMQLAKPIFDRQRRILLAAGRTIHPVYLSRLENMDIQYLFVEDTISQGISMDEMIDMPTWMDAIESVQKAFQCVAQKEELPIRDLQNLAKKLSEEVATRKAIFLIPATSLADDLHDYAHAVNVTLISLQLAKKLNISQIHIKELALGALLHDIGKMLTDDDDEHPKVGFEYLRKIREINLLSAHMAFQHHEAADGSGKPRGVKVEHIHEFAQICGIANVYENAISKKNMAPHEALEYIMTKSGTMFRQELVQIFVQEIPSYIPGTRIRLNDGRSAIVTKILSNVQRPFVRYLDSGEEISLAANHTLLVTEVLKQD